MYHTKSGHFLRRERGYCEICYWSSDVFEISNADAMISGYSEYDENCGKSVSTGDTGVGLQDFIVIPGNIKPII